MITVKIFAISWLVIFGICALETYFTPKFKDKYEDLNKKR